MARVSAHKSKRGNKTVSVKAHDRSIRNGRSITSSFLNSVQENEDGEGYSITIHGRSYPYPFLPDEKVGGIIRGTDGSSGRYYNKHIRGKYF